VAAPKVWAPPRAQANIAAWPRAAVAAAKWAGANVCGELTDDEHRNCRAGVG